MYGPVARIPQNSDSQESRMTNRRHSQLTDFAVVAGIDLNGLGVLRALSRAGVPTVAIDTDFYKPTGATRSGEKVRVRSLSGSAFVEDLLQLRRRFTGNPVLFLTQEASVATVSAEGRRLEQNYRFTLPSQALVEDLLHKSRFQALAEKHGFPIPRAVRLTKAQGPGAADGLKFPCVLKPMTKDAAYGKRFAKAYRVASAKEVGALWSEMRAVVDEVIVQEWIEGSDSDVYFCLQYRAPHGGASVSFVGRKTVQWPILVGGTASCIPAPEVSTELTALTSGFFDAVGFAGMGSMEYKRDTRDGRFYLVEPTIGRTDYQEEIATLNGVNIPLAAYFSELGLEAPAATGRAPLRAWRDPIGYAKARLAGAQDPTSRLAPGIEICDAYFRAYDPLPYLALKLQPVCRRLSVLRRAPG